MISVLIPARNEADRIGDTVRAVAAALLEASQEDAEILVIDDGSTDDTLAAAARAGAHRTLRLDPGRGKGGALNAGLRQASGDIIVTVDADLGSSAAEIGKLLPPVLAGEVDMAIAALPPAGRSGGFGWAVRLSRWAIRRACGVEIPAPLSGQRAIRREALEDAGDFEEGYGAEIGLTLELLRRGFRVVTVRTAIRHRALGRTPAGFLHRGKQLLHVGRAIWRKRAWRRLRPA